MKRLFAGLCVVLLAACASRKTTEKTIDMHSMAASDVRVAAEVSSQRLDSVVDFWHELVMTDSTGAMRTVCANHWRGRWTVQNGVATAQVTESREDSTREDEHEEQSYESGRRSLFAWHVAAVCGTLYVLSIIQGRRS